MMVHMDAAALAERKLDIIIGRFGDAGGERRKEYYKKALMEEAAASICWMAATALMETSGHGETPAPGKASGDKVP